MKLIHYAVCCLAITTFASCDKELSLELGDVNTAKAKDLQELIVKNNFQLKAFYSDVPIDYVDTDDTVKHETNLWAYVSGYLKDDFNSFKANGTDVAIQQNQLKMSGAPQDVLLRHYSITHDDRGAHMQFLDYQYNPLQYDVYKVGADYFILSIRWKNKATLYSRFEMVP